MANAGSFKKGEHRSVKTEFKKGRPAPPGAFKKGDPRLMGHVRWGGGFPKGSKPEKLVHNRPHTEEAKAKMSVANRANAKRGEASCHWKGGTGTARHREMFGWRYKEWRTAVFTRDAYTCCDCGASGGVYLHADHIVEWAKSEERRYDVANGRTLCYRCHYKKTFGKLDEVKALAWGVPKSYQSSNPSGLAKARESEAVI